MHAKMAGAHTVNDYVESIFGEFDHITRTYRYIAVGNAAGGREAARNTLPLVGKRDFFFLRKTILISNI
jgi:hypothetical protein